MSIINIAKQAEKLMSDNAPAILTGIGVTGALATAYFTGKASFKAAEILRVEKARKFNGQPVHEVPMSKKTQFKLLWKLYVPAATTLTVTVASIVLANRVGTRRAAAMAAAFSISEKAASEYKEKVLETVGKTKEEKIRSDVQQDRINANPPTDDNVLNASGGDVLCKDAWSGRYFSSDMETIKKAQNDTNYKALNSGYASLSEFYSKLGLEPTKESDNVGWNGDKLMEIMFTTSISDRQKPVLVMDFTVAPVRNFYGTH